MCDLYKPFHSVFPVFMDCGTSMSSKSLLCGTGRLFELDHSVHRRIYGYIFGEASCFEARRADSGMGSAGGLGSAVSSPSGVWGGAPAEIEFGAFLALSLIHI